MTTTTNYSLKKPDYTDYADIKDINDNMDTIDTILAGKGNVASVNGRTGAVTLTQSDVRLFYGTSAPSDPQTGDIWFKPASA